MPLRQWVLHSKFVVNPLNSRCVSPVLGTIRDWNWNLSCEG